MEENGAEAVAAADVGTGSGVEGEANTSGSIQAKVGVIVIQQLGSLSKRWVVAAMLPGGKCGVERSLSRALYIKTSIAKSLLGLVLELECV